MAADEPNWKRIKARYLKGGVSYRDLADQFGVSLDTLEKRAKREGWASARRQTGGEVAAKLPGAVAAVVVDEVARTTAEQLALATEGAAKLRSALAACEGPSDLKDWFAALRTLQQVQRLALNQAPPKNDEAKASEDSGVSIIPADSNTWQTECLKGANDGRD